MHMSLWSVGVALAASVGCQIPQGDDCPPVGLTVAMVNVGQGDGLVLRTPDGVVHVVDAGEEGAGAAVIQTIQALAPRTYGDTFLSHYHIDHMGGLDDVLQAFPFRWAWDRGTLRAPSNGSYNGYVAAAGTRRRQVVLGSTIQLGGGVTARVLAVNGAVDGGTFVNVTNQTQEENARSIALRIEYGDFSMWLGGDLTGGGNGTPDVESAAALACGDVDVYHVNHHGSNTSTSNNLVTRLDPELCIVSAGQGNPFGHPTFNTVNRLNQAMAARVLLSTTEGAGAIGMGVVGSARITTDGSRYRVTDQRGDWLDFYTDELAASLRDTGLRVAEFHRDPASVSDTNGEYIELANVDPRPIVLDGVRLSDNGGSVLFRTTLVVPPHRPVVVASDAVRGRNGGLPLGAPLPFGSISLGNGSDSIRVDRGGVVMDQLSYSSAWPGGAGQAAERRDLEAPPTLGNFAPATGTFGSGERGSPGLANAADQTVWPIDVAVDHLGDRLLLHAASLDDAGTMGVIGLAWSASPGFTLLGVHVPLNMDSLLDQSLLLPQMVAFVPPGGYRCVEVGLPSPNVLAGMRAHAACITWDLQALQIRQASPAVSFSF